MSSSCIPWHKSLDSQGYGATSVQGKVVKAHRVAYCTANNCTLASIAGLVVRHTCDFPACVNPDHLVIGTQSDNVKDMMERGRHVGSKGARIQRALTDEDVAYIRQSSETPTALAKKFGVARRAIYYWRQKNDIRTA